MSDRTFKLSTLATGVAAVLASAPQAVAQDDTIEEIVVTGSHIRRSEFNSRAPIQVVDSATFDRIGAEQPVEALKEFTVNSGSQFYGEGGGGRSQFNIRNLGVGSTLTLINGKRAGVATGGSNGQDFVDINQFPLAMIERIEVLTDGASATYGSQAVAGVANIITRKGFEGFEISGGYSSAKVDAWHLNLAAGNGSITAVSIFTRPITRRITLNAPNSTGCRIVSMARVISRDHDSCQELVHLVPIVVRSSIL